jgi:hypothetical protein
MDNEFIAFINDFVKQYKKDVFEKIPQCKALLLDHAKGEYKKEIRLLLQILEIGCYSAIINSNDLYKTRMVLINRMREDYFIDDNISAIMIDLLLSFLRNYKIDNNSILEKDQTIIVQKNEDTINNSSIHDYEKEAKAETLYNTAINLFFKAIGNNFTLAIDKLLKAIRLCPNDLRYHYFLCYFLYKLNDNKLYQNEINILKSLNFDINTYNIVSEDIWSTRKGEIAKRLDNAYKRGGVMQFNASQSSIFKTSRINYAESSHIYDLFKDYEKWAIHFYRDYFNIDITDAKTAQIKNTNNVINNNNSDLNISNLFSWLEKIITFLPAENLNEFKESPYYYIFNKILNEKNIESYNKSELRDLLPYFDELLESLPEDKIEEFSKSENFDLYKKLFKELGLV